jgi:hypothetical protein
VEVPGWGVIIAEKGRRYVEFEVSQLYRDLAAEILDGQPMKSKFLRNFKY